MSVPEALARVHAEASLIEGLDGAVVAELAAQGVQDEAQLRRIYSSLEAVLLASADNYDSSLGFEVYGACFGCMSAIVEAYNREPWVVEETVRLLENIHEVYDVLLGCAETYEWAQPGVTGRLRLEMLDVLVATFGAEGLTAGVLMELLNNDVSSAVALLSYVLRTSGARFALQELAARVLVELTTANCLFCPDDGTEGQQITKLTLLLNKHCNALIQSLIQFDVVEAFGRCICEHQESHTRTDILVQSFLGIVHNALLYCTENQKRLRMHLATHSTVVQDIMIPYVDNIMPVLESVPNLETARAMVEFRNLAGALQTFVVCSFNINVLRASFNRSDILLRVMANGAVMQSVAMLEYLVKLLVNIDFVSSPHFPALRDAVARAFEALQPAQQVRLTRRLKRNLHALPMTSSSRSKEALAFCLVEDGEAVEPAPGPAPGSSGRKKRQRNRRRRRGKGKRLFGLQKARGTPGAAAEDEAYDDGEEDSEDEEEEVCPENDAENVPPEPDVPEKAVCELSGGLMHEPMQTPDGHLVDRPVLEDWVGQFGTDPISGNALDLAACVPSNELQRAIADYQSKVLAVDLAEDRAEEPRADIEPTTRAFGEEKKTGLLGDLPSLNGPAADEKTKEKKKIKIKRNNVLSCPEEFKCAIDGKILTQPLRAPSGYVFERKTLESWVETCGSICPVSSAPLRLEDCALDKELQKRVVKWFKESEA